MGLSIDEFFAVIRDGAWHRLDELEDQLGIQTATLIELSNVLSKGGLLNYDAESNRIKLESAWMLLLPNEAPAEPKTTVATVIIPPDTSIEVQSTRISNLSHIELEISLRIADKIKEVAIKL